MATPAPVPKFTVEEYVYAEEYSNVRHEFRRGDVYLMSGGTRAHARAIANVVVALSNALRDHPCDVQGSDLRVRIDAVDLNTYPDVSVVCGPPVMDVRDPNALTNPCLLVEVLSPSTESYDRGDKLRAYQALASVREVMLVAHDQRRVDVIQRQQDGTWRTISAGPGESVALLVGCSLAVDTVYFDRTTA